MEVDIKNEVKARIGEKRFAHTLRVEEEAASLAKRWGADVEKARTAGFFHDCMKIRDRKKLFQKARELGLELTEEYRMSPKVVHGPLGALAAKEYYGIEDPEILNAIARHTMGAPNMTLLDKIIFLADYIEPGRDFPGVEEARKLAYEDLDQGVLFALEETLRHLLDEGEIIAETTVKARNYLRWEG